MALEFVVARGESDWSLTDGQERYAGFGSEHQALRIADMLARDANLSGEHTRVMVRMDDGGLRLETSYGRRTAF